ncbi:Satratoxin biosynthesis SC1 cluster protein 4 [Apiospora hydei]|uniref:Satratoxin biosynthesis SC1 cluster protein 4 n=1 Tax=Apiospora hydei TaxID=1337664 RepID=A0ABR1V2K1_9PEZI
MADTPVIYMGEPPGGEDRWAAWSREGLMQGIGALTMTLATIACTLRVYARTRLIRQKLVLDDYLVCMSTIACWAFYALSLCSKSVSVRILMLFGVTRYALDVRYGRDADFMVISGQVWRSRSTHVANDDGGIHYAIKGEQLVTNPGPSVWQLTHKRNQFTLGLAASYILSSEVAKISILMFYFRISPDRRFHVAVGCMIGILSIYSALYILLNIFGCTPVSDAWNVAKQAAGEAQCIDKGKFYLAAVVVNVAIDFIILLLPIPVIAPLQMPMRRKISLCLLFATGGFTIFAATYNSVLTIKLFASDDYNWELSKELLWMYAELASCVICASGPTLKPVFTLVIFPRLGIRTSASRAGYREHQDGSGGKSNNSGGLKTIGSIASKPKPSRSRSRSRTDGAIELESEDDLSINNNNNNNQKSGGGGRRKTNTTDDQDKLWSRVANHGRDHSSQNFQITSTGTHDDDNGLEPGDDKWKGNDLFRRNSVGINVTREVDIAYDSTKPLDQV